MMFTDINTALDAIMARKNSEYGLRHFSECLESIGNPQYQLKCVHVAGTNGKGSTTNFVRAGLQEAGFKVGTFTSPHLVVHNDRIRINDVMIDDETFLKYINNSLNLWEEFGLSMFEIDMLISIQYFLDEKVDYVVYEVGLGGLLDATNVIKPLISVITNVDMDHMNILGDTIEAIALQKAGIIKDKTPVFTMESKSNVLDVIKQVSLEHHTTLTELTVPDYQRIGKEYHFMAAGIPFVLNNTAVYQVANASLAAHVLKFLDISDAAIKKGIESTQWAGRFEEVQSGVYLDGAHNKMGVHQLALSMDSLPRPWILVFTALQDKDHQEMVSELESIFDEVIITQFDFYRAASAIELAGGRDVIIEEDYKKAIDKGIVLKKDGVCLITGSLYFVSEARAYLFNQDS